MLWIEIICGLIIILYIFVKVWRNPYPLEFIYRYIALCIASWIGEESAILLYDFYQYSSDFHLFIDRVPLPIILIWPIVIESDWTLAKAWSNDIPSREIVFSSLLVLLDAFLIEPISVTAGLWCWNASNFFGVPFIGIFGWAFFGLGCIVICVYTNIKNRLWLIFIAIIFAPLVVHIGILGSWWGLFRWIQIQVSSLIAVAVSCVLSAVASCLAYSCRANLSSIRGEILLRIPPVIFFLSLVGLNAHKDYALIPYTLLFSIPWLILTIRSFAPKR